MTRSTRKVGGRAAARTPARSARSKSAATPTNQFEAAQANRRLAYWNPSGMDINSLLASGGAMLLRRSRDLVRSNGTAALAKETFVGNLIGTGIVPTSLHPDPERRKRINDLFLDWTDEADADGLMDYYGLQASNGDAMFEAGEIFGRVRWRRPGDGLTVPLQIQLLEAEMCPLDKNGTAENGNRIKCGIEFNAIGRRVAYYFLKRHPGDLLSAGDSTGSAETVRVPAFDANGLPQVLHCFKPRRPGQIRGVPWISPALVTLYMIDTFEDAELERKRTAALLVGFMESNTPQTGLDGSPLAEKAAPDDGSPIANLKPGTIIKGLPGEKITWSQPVDVGGNFEAFEYRMLLKACAGMMIPYADGTGDLRQVSYGSLRGGMVNYRRRVSLLQHQVPVFQFCRPIWNVFILAAVLAGKLDLPGYFDNPRAASRAKHIPPAWDWIDPLKDMQAEKIAVDMGAKARSDTIEEQGENPEEVDDRIAADRAREKRLGLNFDNKAGTAPAPSSGKENDDE